MKYSRLRIVLLAILCGTTSLHADIVVLKSGTKLEGNITSETTEAIRIRYKATPKIWDEKTISRADILSVTKQTPQEVEVIELRKVMPTPDLMTTDEYEQLIQDRLRPFVNKYKDTPEATEVESIITKLQAEKTKTSNGEVKLDGKWLTAQEAKGEKFNIDAFKVLTAMRTAATQTKWTTALQEFDKIAKGDAIMRATRHYPTAITEGLAILQNWSSILTKMSLDHPVLKKTREDGLKKLEGADKARTEAAIERETAAWKASVSDAKNKKVRWLEPNKYDLPSIQSAQKEVSTEIARLQAIDLETVKAQNEAFGAVLTKIGEGDYNGGAAAFARVSNFAAPNLYKNAAQAKEAKEIVDDLKVRLLNLYKQLVAKQSTGTVMNKGSSAIGGDSATGVDDRVAKILAEANNKGTATAAPAVAAPGAATAAAPVAAVPGAARPVAPVAPRPVAVPVAPPVAQAPAPVIPPPEESNLQTYLLIGAGVMILVLVIALLNKKK